MRLLWHRGFWKALSPTSPGSGEHRISLEPWNLAALFYQPIAQLFLVEAGVVGARAQNPRCVLVLSAQENTDEIAQRSVQSQMLRLIWQVKVNIEFAVCWTCKDNLAVVVVLVREAMLFCQATERTRRSDGQFVRFGRQTRAKEAAFAYDIPENWSKIGVLTPKVLGFDVTRDTGE